MSGADDQAFERAGLTPMPKMAEHDARHGGPTTPTQHASDVAHWYAFTANRLRTLEGEAHEHHHHHDATRQIRWVVYVATDQPHHHHHQEDPRMSFQLPDNKQVPISVTATDAEDQPTTGTVTLISDDPAIASVVDNGDGTGMVTAQAIGTTNVTATHTDPDGTVVSSVLPFDIVAGDTTTVTILTGELEDKPSE